MLDSTTKKRIDDCRDILVGKVPDPKSQIEQITIALIYKFMDDMDREAVELGGKRRFFSGKYKKYAWQQLFAPDLSGEDRVKLYGEAIETMEENPNIPQLFRDIFSNAYLPYRDPETLREFLKYINDFRYDHSEQLGDAFEYLLSVLGSQGDAGQFRTPRHVIDFMVELIDPQKQDTILDPACGTAGFLISAYKHILKQNSSNYEPGKDPSAFELHGVKLEEITAATGKKYKGDKISPDQRKKLIRNFQGYDISPDMVRLSLANMYLHGFTEPHIYEYDTLTSDERWNDDFDVIMANPPFMSPKGGIRPHNRFSVPSKRSEVLFVDYIMDHLNTRGRAAVIVPEGIIFQTGTAYKSLRKKLVDEDFLVGVISLPAGVFNPYSGVKTSILWMDRELAKKTDDILFVKVENDGFDLGAQRRPIKQNDLPGIFQKLLAYKKELTEGAGFGWDDDPHLWTALKAEVGESGDYNLSGERYKQLDHSRLEIRTVRLEDVCEINLESADPVSKFGESDFVYIDIASVENGTGKVDYTNQVKTIEAPSRARRVVRKGDTLLSTVRPNLRAFAFLENLPDKVLASTGFATLTAKDAVNSKFLYLMVKSDLAVAQMENRMGKGSYPSINQKDVADIEIPLPPVFVQEEMVAEIESYQKIIDGARMVVDNYQPRIDIDPEWPMVELGEITSFVQYGLSSKLNTKGKGYKTFRMNELVDGVAVDDGEMKYADITQKEFEKYKLQYGDILFNRTNSIEHVGRTGIYDIGGNHCFASYLIRVRIDDEYAIPSYVNYFMNTESFQKGIKQFASRAIGQANINAKSLRTYKIPLPDTVNQGLIVQQIEEERAMVNINRKLITRFERKIQERIAKVWGTASGESHAYPEPEEELGMVAEE